MLRVISAAVLGLMFHSAVVYGQEVSGTIFLKDGTKFDVLDLNKYCFPFLTGGPHEPIQKKFSVTHPEMNRKVEVQISDVASVDIFGLRMKNSYNGAILSGRITLKNGSTYEIKEEDRLMTSIVTPRHCIATVMDEVSGEPIRIEMPGAKKVDGSFDWSTRIVRVEVHGSGNARWSESSERVFPPDFLFDPYTGTRLVPYER